MSDPRFLSTSPASTDETDAVHPRLSQGSSRGRRPSRPAFVCDTCRRDSAVWRDGVDHAYRSGHGLAARCGLCRLPAVRCRRKGRPGLWHRCVVVDTVRRLGAGNIAVLVEGANLTAPRPWRLSCAECGAGFGAKTARLVRHLVERAHSVESHCERCLFPVFVFGLNDERRQMHVCVGNSGWLRAEEGALLASASETDAVHNTQSTGAVIEDRRDGTGLSGGTSSHGQSHLNNKEFNRYHGHSNGEAAPPGVGIASDCHNESNAGSGNSPGHNYERAGVNLGDSADVSCNGGVASGTAGSNGSVSRGNGRVMSLTSVGPEKWPEERTPSCVAI